MFLVLSVSIGYSSLSTSLNITGLVTKVRLKSDIRITDLEVSSISNEGKSNYLEYNKENISVGISLPNNNSTVTYKVEVTNIGNVEMGLLSIDNIPSNIEVLIDNKTYNKECNEETNTCSLQVKEKICDTANVCKLGISKEYSVTLKYTSDGYNSSSTEYNLNLDFNFKQIYNITYEGITNNNYPSSVLEGETLTVEFTSPIPEKVVPYTNDTKVEYTYENNKITVPNVTGDILLKYIDKVYLTTLSEGKYFKESAYLTKIKTVQFVDSVDIPSTALATYNLEENNGDEIKGWIDTNYNLYIGSEWDIYSKDLTDAFRAMSGVTSITFNNLNTSEVTNMQYMLYNMSSLTSLDVSSFNTSNVTNMKHMFENLSKITELNVSSFNTSKVTEMASMFQGMSSLRSLDVSKFDTSKVTRMDNMFYGMSALTSLNLSNFNTSKVTRMDNMFYGMSALTSLNLSSFNTSKVTNMGEMFSGNSALTSLDLSNFNTSNVTSMGYMFQSCSSLTSLDVSNFDTSKVTDMNGMFGSVTSLISLDLSSFNTSKLKSASWMFNMNSKLKTVYVSNLWDLSAVTSSTEMVNACRSIVGGEGTKYDNNYIDKTYARIDGGTSSPGYFTYKEYIPKQV